MEIKELLDKVEGNDKAELVILHNAYVKSLDAVKVNGDEGNLRTYRAAKAALDSLIEKLTIKYFPQISETEPVFANRIEALKHLKGLGYKLGKSKFYKDAAEGLVRFEPDGTITEKSLDRYVKLTGIRKFSDLGKNATEEKEAILYDKAFKEVEKLSEQVRELKTKNEILEGQYFKKSEFDMEMAGRASMLDAGLRQVVRVSAEKLIRSVHGDATMAPMLCEAFDAIIDSLMRDYADTKRFLVILEHKGFEGSRIQGVE